MSMSKPEANAPAAADAGGATRKAKTLTGRVVSNKMSKTIMVAVERYVPHPVYRKYMRRSTNFMAHDENNESREGDLVAIEECRPLSRHKSWRLVKIVTRAPLASVGGAAAGAEESTR